MENGGEMHLGRVSKSRRHLPDRCGGVQSSEIRGPTEWTRTGRALWRQGHWQCVARNNAACNGPTLVKAEDEAQRKERCTRGQV